MSSAGSMCGSWEFGGQQGKPRCGMLEDLGEKARKESLNKDLRR